jgi:hypothetical protein
MKTTRINCGVWSINNTDVELATELFGPGGTQASRRWFYRLIDKPNTKWRGQRRIVDMNVMLYFRNSADATFFALKKSD